MKKKAIFLSGFLGILLVLCLFFSCEDLAEEEDGGPGGQVGSEGLDVKDPAAPRAERPEIIEKLPSGIYVKDTPVNLSVEATVDSGNVTYQWYKNTQFSVVGGEVIDGATQSSYSPVTTEPGDTYYYAKITNTDNSKTENTYTRTSSPVLVRVVEAANDVVFPTSTKTITLGNTSGVITKSQYISGFGGMSNAWTSPGINKYDLYRMYNPDYFGYNLYRVMIYPNMDDLFDGTQNAPAKDPDVHKRYYDMVGLVKSLGAKEGAVKILASPWTMRAEWKTNNALLNGSLKTANYQDYAGHLKDYIARMEENGAPIDYISIQNEPDIAVQYEGCEWKAEEMRDFVKAWARDIAPANGSVKIMPGESYNFGVLNNSNYYDALLNDSEAVSAIDLIGGHIYGNGTADKPFIRNKGLDYWMTEHNINTSGNASADPQWGRVWVFIDEVHTCMSNGFSAFIWWYAKRYYSFIGDGEGGTLDGQMLFRGYALSHYAKYATGKNRINVTKSGLASDVNVTAYESDDEFTLVLYNKHRDNDAGTVNIKLPVAVESASMVLTGSRGIKGTGTETSIMPSQVNTEGWAMVPQLVLLSADKKTAYIELPRYSIASIRFIKATEE